MATQAVPEAAIDIGRVIQRGFSTIGRQGVAFLGLAAVLVGIPTFLTQYLLMSSAASSDPAAAMAMMTSPVYWLGILITVIAGFLLQAAIVRASIEDLQ